MIEQNTLVSEPAQVVPTDSKSFRNISPDHKRALRKAQEGLERPVPDRTASLAQANEQLRHEIQERRHAEELLLKEQRYLRCLLELQDGIDKWIPTKSMMGWSSNSPLRSYNLRCSVGSQDSQTTRSVGLSRPGCKGLTSACGKHCG